MLKKDSLIVLSSKIEFKSEITKNYELLIVYSMCSASRLVIHNMLVRFILRSLRYKRLLRLL